MRLLVVYPYVPYPPDRGTFQRTYHLLRALAKDHEVDLLALCENGEREDQKPHFPEMTVSDGPHGVRRVVDVNALISTSLPATCFPTAS